MPFRLAFRFGCGFAVWHVRRRLKGYMWRRYLFVLTFAWWMGGLTFYALVVIPTAEQVLGNHREVGFITQRVTIWLNLLLGNLIADWRFARRWPRYGLIGTWVVMLVSHLGLFIAHSWVTQALDLSHHRIPDFSAFELRHGVYEGLVTIQWVAALIHAWLALMTWRIRDGSSHGTDCAPAVRAVGD